ncbi:DUF6879 family protein [Nonomuraea sp. NPDC050790]|uniref:DUF6879 family protein n=1 Tax=Nonomuraea sp. NPDC050790 TaxID=3364371 RepID=UPI00379BE1E5
MTVEEWRVLFDAFERDAFHLELRDSYGVAGEQSRFGRWLAGERQSHAEVAAWFADWTDKVRAKAAEGRSVRRVRVISEPVSPYIEFEWQDTVHNVEAGEDIRWLPRHLLPEQVAFPVDGNDWWLLDDRIVVVNRFDEEGRSAGRELVDDPGVISDCVQVRNLLWSVAIPHAEYKPVIARP